LMGNNFVFQQDGASAQWAKMTQVWVAEHCLVYNDDQCMVNMP